METQLFIRFSQKELRLNDFAEGSCIVLIGGPSPQLPPQTPPRLLFLVIITSSECSLSVVPQDKEDGGKTEGGVGGVS